VKPAAFSYFAPTTVDEALGYLGESGDDAALLAGGQSLVPLMNFRLATPSVVIDLNRIVELDHLEVTDAVSLGATTRQLTVERSAEIQRRAPILANALRYVGHVAIRSRGTIAGSIAQADPAAELPAVLLALEGDVVARGPRGERAIPAERLFVGPYSTSLEFDEMIVEVRFPVPKGGWAINEVARRRGDFAIGGAVAGVVSDGTRITDARLSLFGVETVPARFPESEKLLIGRRIDDSEALAEAARLVMDHVSPPDDSLIPASYRCQVARVVARRALEEAVQRGVQ
jgi:aerobic carbon-monoxide dehydrogenase medium subunit